MSDAGAVPSEKSDPSGVARATAFIDHYAGHDIGLAEIAAAARVGTRGLQQAFRRDRGTTPLAYLRDIRMTRAHHDLAEADPEDGRTVGDVVARWRFSHPGRFAVEHRRQYGESPSVTLRRDPLDGVRDTRPELPMVRRDGTAPEVALLDTAGVITRVNRAWDGFCLANGGDPARSGVGCSYLAICDAAAEEDPVSALMAAAIRAALHGGLSGPARIPLPCTSDRRPAIFDVFVSTRRDDAGHVLGATVVLSES